jgi:hypothetical protein
MAVIHHWLVAGSQADDGIVFMRALKMLEAVHKRGGADYHAFKGVSRLQFTYFRQIAPRIFE